MNKIIWIVIVLGLVLAGGWWYFSTANIPSITEEDQENTAESSSNPMESPQGKLEGAFDHNPIVVSARGKSSTSVTLTGTAHGVTSVAIEVLDHPTAVVFVDVVNGTWSATLDSIPPGTYTVYVSTAASARTLAEAILQVTP